MTQPHDPERFERWVSADVYAEATQQIEAYNRKAEAAGIQQLPWPGHPQVRQSRVFYAGRTLERAIAAGHVVYGSLLDKAPDGFSTFPGLIEQYLVEVDLVAISLGDWTVVGTIETQSDGNLIRTIARQLDIPARYRSSGSACEHCAKVRSRKRTYLLRNELNEFRQIGGSCIQEFIGGHVSADVLIELAEKLLETLHKMEALPAVPRDIERDKPQLIELPRYLAHVIQRVRHDGWISRKDETGEEPTADAALREFVAGFHGVQPPPEDFAKAQAVMEWATNLDESKKAANSFLVTVSALAAKGTVLHDQIGVAAAMTLAYDREVQRRTENVQVGPMSHYVGRVHERCDFGLVTCKQIRPLHSRGLFVHRMLDSLGNLIVWIAGQSQLTVGESYMLKATVRAHQVHEGVQQTLVSRPRATVVET